MKKSKQPAQNVITGCTFIGAQYDAKAVNAIEAIAIGLQENARALGNLAKVLKASNVEIETMLRISGPSAEIL